MLLLRIRTFIVYKKFYIVKILTDRIWLSIFIALFRANQSDLLSLIILNNIKTTFILYSKAL